VHQLEIMPEPPGSRADEHPWPVWPVILRSSAAHEEGGHRLFSVTTTELVDDGSGAVRALRGHQVEVTFDGGRPTFTPVPGSEFELPCNMVLLAMGFTGSERRSFIDELGLDLDSRGSIGADSDWATNLDGVFVCGDATRGQSLIVWAISEGRSAAAAADRWLMGDSALPAPIEPGRLALR
jgi:glutamate synthase (NADPH/NADH) small chain